MALCPCTKTRRFFGRQTLYSDRNEVILNQPANHSYFQKLFILKSPVNRSTNLSKILSISQNQTDNVSFTNYGLNHTEGGWSNEINYLDEDQNIKYKKKVERDNNWGRQCIDLSRSTLHNDSQNSAIDIYEDYFSDYSQKLKTNYKAVNFQIYHDLKYPNRSVSSIDWMKREENRFLAVQSVFDIYPPKIIEKEFYIWDCQNLLIPFLKLTSPSLATKAKFCPKNENIIAGGLSNGMVAVWDCRKGGSCIANSTLEVLNREAITAFCWIHSKANTEFYSGSLDGIIRYWDGRNLRCPTFEVCLDPIRREIQNSDAADGCTFLEFEFTIPSKYLVGTLKGQLFLGNRKVNSLAKSLSSNFKVLDGPVLAIERNSFFVKNILVLGKYCAKIYSEEHKEYPIITFSEQLYEFTCANWSPARCSVFVTGSVNGKLAFWDLLLDQKKPTLILNEIKCAITALSFKKDGKYLAVGTISGDVYMIAVDEIYAKGGTKEKSSLSTLFERELLRVKLMEGKAKEMFLRYETNVGKFNLSYQFTSKKPEREHEISFDTTEHESVFPKYPDIEKILKKDDVGSNKLIAYNYENLEKNRMITESDIEIVEARRNIRELTFETETNKK